MKRILVKEFAVKGRNTDETKVARLYSDNTICVDSEIYEYKELIFENGEYKKPNKFWELYTTNF